MANKVQVSAEKLREIEQFIYECKGIEWACRQASIKPGTYRQARVRCFAGEGPQWQKAHFERHADLRWKMQLESAAEAPDQIRAMGQSQGDWRALAKAAEMVEERVKATQQGGDAPIVVEVVERGSDD